jgi:hypothetical protein
VTAVAVVVAVPLVVSTIAVVVVVVVVDHFCCHCLSSTSVRVRDISELSADVADF